MDWVLVLQLALMGALLGGSGFFSGSETALFGLSRVKRRAMERRAGPAARTVLDLLSEPRRLLITILVGNTFVNVALSSLGTSVAERVVGGERALGVAIFAVTTLVLLMGEVLPKVLAVRFGETFSLRVAPTLAFVHRALRPVNALLEWITDRVLRSLPAPEAGYLSARELSTLLKIGEERGAIHAGEVELVEGIIALRQTDARDVMTPRVEVQGLPCDPFPEDLAASLRELRRRIVPLFGEDLDDLRGVLRARALLLAGPGVAVEDFVVEPYLVPEGKKLADLLEDFRTTGISFAVVLDEYGGFSGLLTLEDILEELFGEVFDRGEHEEFEIRPEGEGYRILGGTALADVEEELGFHFDEAEEDGVSTLAGFMMARLGKVPRRGDVVDHGGWRFRVAYVVKRRVVSVEATRLPGEEAAA